MNKKKLLAIFSLIGFSLILTSCFLKKKSQDRRKFGPSSAVIDKNNIFLNRTSYGTALVLSFKTKVPVYCQLRLWSQENNKTPSQDAPLVYNCINDKAKTDLQETINNLNASTLYNIEIQAKVSPADDKFIDKVIVKETAGSSANGDPTQDGKFQDVLIAKVNLPLRVTEIYRHKFAESIELAKLKEQLTRQPICQVNIPDNLAIFSESEDDIVIKGLATRGFASASAAAHPHFPNRLKLLFNTLQNGDLWEWDYEAAGKSYQFRTSPLGTLKSVALKSNDSSKLQDPDLSKPGDPLKVDPKANLDITWKTENLNEYSFFSLQIGAGTQKKSVFCLYNANLGQASITPELLKELPAGKQYVSGQLETIDLKIFPGTTQPTWIIFYYDWKNGRIEI